MLYAQCTWKQPGHGTWEWHQDYRYWYELGCLFPRRAAIFIALDDTTLANGCLRVLRGSHHAGRFEHVQVGRQSQADPARLASLRAVCPEIALEMSAGDALVFDANLLHTSGVNDTAAPRRSLILNVAVEEALPTLGPYRPHALRVLTG